MTVSRFKACEGMPTEGATDARFAKNSRGLDVEGLYQNLAMALGTADHAADGHRQPQPALTALGNQCRPVV